jgi:hypothetical protein
MAEPSGKRPTSTKIGLLVLSLVIVVVVTIAGGIIGLVLSFIFGGDPFFTEPDDQTFADKLLGLGVALGFISGMVLSYAIWWRAEDKR